MRPVKMVFVVGCGIALLWSLRPFGVRRRVSRGARSFNGRPASRLDLIPEFGERYPDGQRTFRRLPLRNVGAGMRDTSPQRTRGLVGLASQRSAVQRAWMRYSRSSQMPFSPIHCWVSGGSCLSNAAENLGLPELGSNSAFRVTASTTSSASSLDHLDADPVRLFKPEGRFVNDVDLHFDGERMLLSTGEDRRWRVFGLGVDGTGLQLPIDEPDIDNYDACYLPDEPLLFSSTACLLASRA